eukprot:PLAT3302.29.p1 GENE.PLAT3302.29~~PLAT3302.29.p1  ORF type:complete len:451 (+),score=94.28 PLAT3302.29:194-1354(+)
MVQKECVAYAENSAAARSEEDAIALAKQAERVKRLQLLSSERFATYALIAQVPVGSIIYVVWGAVDSSVAFSRRGQYNWTILHVLPALIFFAIVTPFMLPFIKYMKKEPDMHSMAVEVAAHNAIGPPVLLGVLIGLTVNPLNVHVPIVAWVTQIGISIMLVIPALMSCGFDPTRGRWCLHWRSRRVAAAYEWAGEDEVVALQRIVDDDTGCYLFQRLLQERSAITALLFVQAVDAVEGDADHCAAVRRRISDTFLVDGAVLHVQLVAGNNAAVAASIEKGSGEEALASARKDMWERLAEQHVAAFLAVSAVVVGVVGVVVVVGCWRVVCCAALRRLSACGTHEQSPYFAMWVQSAGYLSRYVYGRKDSLEGVDSISEMELVELPVI